MTSPARIASALRYVAQKLDNSREPSRSAVAFELNCIVAAAAGAPRPRRADGTEMPLPPPIQKLWDSEEGSELLTDMRSTQKERKVEQLPFHLKSLKRHTQEFMDFLDGFEKPEEEDDEDVFTSAPRKKDIKPNE